MNTIEWIGVIIGGLIIFIYFIFPLFLRWMGGDQYPPVVIDQPWEDLVDPVKKVITQYDSELKPLGYSYATSFYLQKVHQTEGGCYSQYIVFSNPETRTHTVLKMIVTRMKNNYSVKSVNCEIIRSELKNNEVLKTYTGFGDDFFQHPNYLLYWAPQIKKIKQLHDFHLEIRQDLMKTVDYQEYNASIFLKEETESNESNQKAGFVIINTIKNDTTPSLWGCYQMLWFSLPPISWIYKSIKQAPFKRKLNKYL